MAEAVSPLLLERYELKYLVPAHLVDEISAYVSDYCDMDYYSEISPSKFYVINSLYFDSPKYSLLRAKLEDQPVRYNLRVRSYGSNPKPPCFFEVKRKEYGFVKKSRGRVDEPDWWRLLNDFSYDLKPSERKKNVESFQYLSLARGLVPQIFTQYERKAYLSRFDDYARVTFDRNLRCYREQNYDVIPKEDRMENYDVEEIFEKGDGDHILELKCPATVPKWMLDLIKTFELQRVAFSKFGSAMLQLLRDENLLYYPRSSTLK